VPYTLGIKADSTGSPKRWDAATSGTFPPKSPDVSLLRAPKANNQADFQRIASLDAHMGLPYPMGTFRPGSRNRCEREEEARQAAPAPLRMPRGRVALPRAPADRTVHFITTQEE